MLYQCSGASFYFHAVFCVATERALLRGKPVTAACSCSLGSRGGSVVAQRAHCQIYHARIKGQVTLTTALASYKPVPVFNDLFLPQDKLPQKILIWSFIKLLQVVISAQSNTSLSQRARDVIAVE